MYAPLSPVPDMLGPDTDTVTISSGLKITDQSIGVASEAQGFSGVDGILGIGPVDLTQGTVSSNQLIPTVTDNLFAQGAIAQNSIGISYEPSTDSSGAVNGELTFGGVDESRCVHFWHILGSILTSQCRCAGDINYIPITQTSPASAYWGIDQSISYGGEGKTLLDTTAGIVDTGTTLVMIATDGFQAYQKATGAKMDEETGLLTVTNAQFKKMESMFFNIGA